MVGSVGLVALANEAMIYYRAMILVVASVQDLARNHARPVFAPRIPLNSITTIIS